MKRLVFTIGLIAVLSLSSYAEERPLASLKAQYTAWHKHRNEKTGDIYQKEDKFILQIGNGASYYYDPQTYFVDSLQNDPNGSAIYDSAFKDAAREYRETNKDLFKIMKEKGLMKQSQYKCLKNFATNLITVWDSNGGDKYQYEVDINDLSWQLCDSTEIVLDYECNLASADYHGRKWKAWFVPDVPVQDGPWQLCGLPGLIMKAETEDGEYGFYITGLQQCNETFKPNLINPDKLFKTKRKSYLKTKDYSRRNRAAQISALTGGRVNPKNADYKGSDDFLETDYHD